MSQGRKVYLEAIRIVAIWLVIFNHTDGFIYYTTTDNWLTWLYSIVLSAICRTAVPLFLMISGALLLGKEESFKTLFCKRVLRIVLVIVVFSALYYLLDIANNRISEAGVVDFLTRLLNSDRRLRESFWFLYAYLFFLLSLPLLRKLASGINETLIFYMICLKGINDLVLPLLNGMYGIVVSFDIKIICDYIYYGFMGYYLTHMGETTLKKISKRRLCVCLGILVILSIGIVQLLYLKMGIYVPSNLDMLLFLMTPVLWLLIREITESLPDDSRINSLIIAIGGCAFGIYLLDNFVRWQFLSTYVYLSEHTVGVFANSVYVVLVFVIGGIYTWVLKKIPLLKKFL